MTTAAAEDLELLQGTLDVLVLRSLMWGSRHGYEVARWIRGASAGELSVEGRALYVSLHRLEDRGSVAGEWGISENNRKARYYRLTPAGRRLLREESSRWARYAGAVFKVLRAGAAAGRVPA